MSDAVMLCMSSISSQRNEERAQSVEHSCKQALSQWKLFCDKTHENFVGRPDMLMINRVRIACMTGFFFLDHGFEMKKKKKNN